MALGSQVEANGENGSVKITLKEERDPSAGIIKTFLNVYTFNFQRVIRVSPGQMHRGNPANEVFPVLRGFAGPELHFEGVKIFGFFVFEPGLVALVM